MRQLRVMHRPLPPCVAGERVHWLLRRTSFPLFPFPRPPPADGGKGREGGAYVWRANPIHPWHKATGVSRMGQYAVVRPATRALQFRAMRQRPPGGCVRSCEDVPHCPSGAFRQRGGTGSGFVQPLRRDTSVPQPPERSLRHAQDPRPLQPLYRSPRVRRRRASRSSSGSSARDHRQCEVRRVARRVVDRLPRGLQARAGRDRLAGVQVPVETRETA